MENEHSGHRSRMRARFLETGLTGFSEHELLELMLYYAIPQGDTNPLAHRLIKRFGSLTQVLSADMGELKKVEGVGEATAFMLTYFGSIAARYDSLSYGRRTKLTASGSAAQYCISMLKGRRSEAFLAVCLDAQFGVLHSEFLSTGTPGEVPVLPRTVVEYMLRHSAHSALIAHNHPGLDERPSLTDILLTDKITEALRAVEIPLIDHIIVAGTKYFSFANDRKQRIEIENEIKNAAERI